MVKFKQLWFEGLDPKVAETVADYLESKEALDVITCVLDASARGTLSFDNPFSPRTRALVEEYPEECTEIIMKSEIQAYFALIGELRQAVCMAQAKAWDEQKRKEEEAEQ